VSKHFITVGALRRILDREDPKRLVILASDSEGNDYHALHSVSSNMAYSPKTREIGLSELTPMALKLGATEDDVLPKGRAAIVLYP
jgi:hypothetical protein